MPTNDERREVAVRLREHQHGDVGFPTYEGGMIASWLRLKEALDAKGCDPQEDHTMMFGYLADLIEPEPERTCRVECVKHGPLFDVLRFSCCGYEWAENRTDPGATEPDPNYCPNCGARVVE